MKKLLFPTAGLVTLLLLIGAINTTLMAQAEPFNPLLVSNNGAAGGPEEAMMPLVDLLSSLEQHFEVTFLFKDKVVRRKRVNTDRLQLGGDTGVQLAGILTQLGLTYYQVDEQTYVLLPAEDAAQETISGTVTGGESGESLPGVNILVKGTSTGASTDADGQYELEVESLQDTLVVSYIGYQTKEVPINGRKTIDVTLRSESIAGEEIVVVGYGKQEQKTLTASVSSMKGEELESVPVTDISNAIGGRMSGVITQQTSGSPGENESDIYIRGVSTIGSTKPLLIVNGIPRDFQQLDPNAVESMTVLKDAEAVAQYGVAGANGVILVQTKEGKTGEPTVSYNGYVGFQNPAVEPKIADSYEYATLRNRAAENDGKPKPYSDFELQKYKDGSEPDVYPPYNDPLGELSRNNAALTNHSLSVSGGSDDLQYYANIGYLEHQGMWETTNSKRYSLNFNIDAKVSNSTDISLAVNGNVRNSRIPATDHPERGQSRIFALLQYSNVGYQTGPTFFSNGKYGTFTGAAVFGSGYNKRQHTSLFSQLNLTQKLPFIQGLEFKGTIAYDPSFEDREIWQTPMHVFTIDTTQSPYAYEDGIYGPSKSSMSVDWQKSYQITYQASLEYDKYFGNHGVRVLGVFEAKQNKISKVGASRRNYDIDIDEINAGSSSSEDMTTSGISSQERQLGLVYSISYDYKAKYLVGLSGRYDGHYYFAPENRFGFFPSFSLGWRISEENFFKDNISWISDFKIRGSYGTVGALAGSGFQYLNAYNLQGPKYVLGGEGVQAATQNVEANPGITWERAKKTNIGVDLSFKEGMIDITADYFYEKRSNMLVEPDVAAPLEYGIKMSQTNEGVMENQGIEFSGGINYDFSKDLNIGLRGTFTYAKNKVLEIFENPVTYNNPNRRRTGRPLGTQFGYKSIGYFNNDDFDSKGNLKSGIADQPWGDVQPGDIRYKDMNGDGEIDPEDQVAIGDPTTPGILYGFSPKINFKNFSLNMFFQGAGLRTQYYQKWSVLPFYGSRVAYTFNEDYWTPDNKNARFPRIASSPTENTQQKSSHWMIDASYLRLKNAKLSYNFTNILKDKIKVENLMIYISGENLLTWSNTLKFGYDPENISSVGRYYMQQRVISIGLNLTF